MGKTILIVDDDIDVGDSLAEFLESRGHTVTLARNGFEAIEINKTKKFDVIISDIRMPKMDGVELIRNLQVLTPSLVFFFITGYTDFPEAFLKGLNPKGILNKPFNASEIETALNTV